MQARTVRRDGEGEDGSSKRFSKLSMLSASGSWDDIENMREKPHRLNPLTLQFKLWLTIFRLSSGEVPILFNGCF